MPNAAAHAPLFGASLWTGMLVLVNMCYIGLTVPLLELLGRDVTFLEVYQYTLRKEHLQADPTTLKRLDKKSFC